MLPLRDTCEREAVIHEGRLGLILMMGTFFRVYSPQLVQYTWNLLGVSTPIWVSSEKERIETVRCETVWLWSLSLVSYRAGSCVAWHLCGVTVSVAWCKNVLLLPAQFHLHFSKRYFVSFCTKCWYFGHWSPCLWLEYVSITAICDHPCMREQVIHLGHKQRFCSSGWVMFPSYSGGTLWTQKCVHWLSGDTSVSIHHYHWSISRNPALYLTLPDVKWKHRFMLQYDKHLPTSWPSGKRS